MSPSLLFGKQSCLKWRREQPWEMCGWTILLFCTQLSLLLKMFSGDYISWQSVHLLPFPKFLQLPSHKPLQSCHSLSHHVAITDFALFLTIESQQQIEPCSRAKPALSAWKPFVLAVFSLMPRKMCFYIYSPPKSLKLSSNLTESLLEFLLAPRPSLKQIL